MKRVAKSYSLQAHKIARVSGSIKYLQYSVTWFSASLECRWEHMT